MILNVSNHVTIQQQPKYLLKIYRNRHAVLCASLTLFIAIIIYEAHNSIAHICRHLFVPFPVLPLIIEYSTKLHR